MKEVQGDNENEHDVEYGSESDEESNWKQSDQSEAESGSSENVP